MKIEQLPLSLTNMIYGTEPEVLEDISIEEENDRIIRRGARLRSAVHTDGFKDIYEWIKKEQSRFSETVMLKGSKGETQEEIEYTREVFVQRYKSYEALLKWIEREIRNSDKLLQELSEERKEGGAEASSSEDSGSKEVL